MGDNKNEVVATLFCEIGEFAKGPSSQAFADKQNGLLFDRKTGQKQAAEKA